ncbi:MAG: hypothetical protein KDJ74_03905 [Notoacmeibacter sp.]|nr:hypothetical protein [Notoacmeibacter sp.]
MPPQGKIFGIGLSKTGTTSLYTALEMMGYRAGTFRHMRKLGLSGWMAGDFSKDHFIGLDAVTDLPVGTWFRELDARYPGSKFILTVRDSDAWLGSIERQFRSNPDPAPGFIRDVRLAQYGVTTFNEMRFRRILTEHEQAVRAHFAGRPDDLLVMDVFSGDGWDKLSAFLGRPAPDAPFPSVKPGFRAAGTPQTPASQGGFGVVIPLVHPQGSKVSDYSQVEQVLRITLASILNLDGGPARVAVVCHRVPDWASSMPETVRFLDLGDHALLAPGQHDVQIDKGLKYLLGLHWMLGTTDAAWIMPADGDDFLHRSLINTVRGQTPLAEGLDGFLVTEGVHAALRWNGDRLAVQSAFKVAEFNRTCGTCRIFDAARLAAATSKLLASLPVAAECFDEDKAARVLTPKPGVVDGLMKQAASVQDAEDGIIRLLGRHVRQSPSFRFAMLPGALAAKGCGHGNHDGPRHGEIHWNRMTGFMGNKAFAAAFGLKGLVDAGDRPPADTLHGLAGMVNWRRRQAIAALMRLFGKTGREY